jgi:hypothetical protein
MALNTTSPALLEAFSAYIAPAIERADWADAATMAAKNAARDEITARIERELIAQGAEPRIAMTAANCFMMFGFAPGFGLGDMDDQQLAASASRALKRWIEGVIAAHDARSRPAYGARVAA